MNEGAGGADMRSTFLLPENEKEIEKKMSTQHLIRVTHILYRNGIGLHIQKKAGKRQKKLKEHRNIQGIIPRSGR